MTCAYRSLSDKWIVDIIVQIEMNLEIIDGYDRYVSMFLLFSVRTMMCDEIIHYAIFFIREVWRCASNCHASIGYFSSYLDWLHNIVC